MDNRKRQLKLERWAEKQISVSRSSAGSCNVYQIHREQDGMPDADTMREMLRTMDSDDVANWHELYDDMSEDAVRIWGVKLVRQTAKAMLFDLPGPTKPVWIPKSQVYGLRGPILDVSKWLYYQRWPTEKEPSLPGMATAVSSVPAVQEALKAPETPKALSVEMPDGPIITVDATLDPWSKALHQFEVAIGNWAWSVDLDNNNWKVKNDPEWMLKYWIQARCLTVKGIRSRWHRSTQVVGVLSPLDDRYRTELEQRRRIYEQLMAKVAAAKA